MEVGDKLKELNMTVEEVDRLTKALKDNKFGEMLRDYANEISDPENKKKYEEEIELLEQERGNIIEFIHPEPFRCLRTSSDGTRKCFINICANGKVGKPACEGGTSEDGRVGQRWTLPHSLHPGRQDRDTKGNTIVIYDVIFHPDTIRFASKNKTFMKMVDSTAVQGIRDAFKVTLDENNVREMSVKYKGTPRPCVIRKPIPGYKSKEPSEEVDPLAFPYPDERRPQMEPKESHATKKSSDASPKSCSLQPGNDKQPTRPNYAVKYRSFLDLQDFRYSRDSAQSPRPKEIVVTIDLPLLKAVSDASLEVKERQLLLVSKKPSYRLELPLSYPVDEEKGEAKFNRQRRQLTVTLSVLPSHEAFDPATAFARTSVGDDDSQEEWKEEEEEEEKRAGEGVFRQQTGEEKVEAEGKTGHERGDEQMMAEEEGESVEKERPEAKRKGENGTQKEKNGFGQGAVEEILKEQKQENETANSNLHKKQQLEDTEDSGLPWDTVDVSAQEENSSPGHNKLVATLGPEDQLVSITAEHPSREEKEGDVTPTSRSESPPIKKEVETEAAFVNHRSSEEPQTPTQAEPPSRSNIKDGCVPAREDTEDPSATGSVEQQEEHGNQPPPGALREIDNDGNEKIISDHFTTAEFIFQNSLIYELD
ncbi:dnaaf2 [Pungitius sinensis]